MQFIKYIPFILVGIAAIMAVYHIFTKDHLIKWFLQTLQENGKPSGKALAAFGCINSLLIGFYVSMYYGEGHIPPEWYCILIASLAASFYGIREVGRFITTKFGSPEQAVVSDTAPQQVNNQIPLAKKIDPNAQNAPNTNQVVPDEIG